MRYTGWSLVCGFTVSALLLAPGSRAATFTVTNLNDGAAPGPAGSLRRALSDANAAAGTDTVVFQSGLIGTITLTSGHLPLTQSVNINGPGAYLITVSGNGASGIFATNSGGNYYPGVNVTISGLTLADGLAGYGAAIQNYSGGQLTVTSCTFSNNVGNQFIDGGGAIYWRGGLISVNGSTFINNNHVQGGGAIMVAGAGTNFIADCTFVSNSQPLWHGCVNCGAQYETSLLNCTFVNNGAPAVRTTQSGSGLVAAYYRNCIFSGPAPLTSATGNALIFSLGHNLSNDTTGTVPDATDLQFTDPRVADLGAFGGPVQTCPPLPGSPAIDAGDNANLGLATDQRGRPRIASGGCTSGHVDIGAVEAQVYPVTNTNDSGAGSLRQAIADNNAFGAGIVCISTTGTIGLSGGPVVSQMPVDIRGPGAAVLIVSGSSLSRVLTLNALSRLSGVTIANGANASPSGVFNNGGLIVDACRFTNNVSPSTGGALRAFYGNYTISNTTFDNNRVLAGGGSLGGALWIDSGANVTMTNCTLSGNSANSDAGAIYGNYAGSGTPVVTLRNCTLAGNSAPGGAAISGGAAFTLNLQNTILASSGANVSGMTSVSLGNNLSTDATGNLTQPTDQVNTNPKLLPLGFYGGQTATRALLRGSPAIDAGASAGAPVTDQRGQPRRNGDCLDAVQPDSGAFEFDPGDYALTLNGTTQYANCGAGAALNLTSGFTLEARVRPTSLAGIARIVSYGAPSGYGFGRNQGRLRFTTYERQDFDTFGGYLTSGVWTHVAVTFDNAYTARFYVDGALVETVFGAQPAAAATQPFFIGRNASGIEYWRGDLDEIRVWNIVRTPAAIAATHRTTLYGDEPGLVGYWRLDENTGGVVVDAIGGNHGTVFSSPTWTLLDDCAVGPVGDMDCDGDRDFFDIDPFVLALSGEAAYLTSYPNCVWRHADCDLDGEVDFFDIDPFIAVLGQ